MRGASQEVRGASQVFNPQVFTDPLTILVKNSQKYIANPSGFTTNRVLCKTKCTVGKCDQVLLLIGLDTLGTGRGVEEASRARV